MVQTGDVIELDVQRGILQLHVSDAELASRRAAWRPGAPGAQRGYERLFVEHVTQADRGIDFDFLVGGSGATAPPRRPF